VAADARHGRGQEHGGGDLAWEPRHGEGDVEPAEAVANEDQPLAVGRRGHRVQQRARVLLKRGHLVEARGVHPGRGHVERGRPVPRGAQPRHHLVPAPRAVRQAVHDDEVLVAAALHGCRSFSRRLDCRLVLANTATPSARPCACEPVGDATQGGAAAVSL
jgi:hypothetical protein